MCTQNGWQEQACLFVVGTAGVWVFFSMVKLAGVSASVLSSQWHVLWQDIIESHPNSHEFVYKQNIGCGQLTQYINYSTQCYWFGYFSVVCCCEVYVPPHNRGQYGGSY